MPDSIHRFSPRVLNYVRFRPGYPSRIAEFLRSECRLPGNAVIADIGCGTGFLAKIFLDAGFEVTGVEPNRDMRAEGDEFLAAYPRFRSISGTAERTGLGEHTCNLAVAGQAFHWFDVERARLDWQRILKPASHAALIWNERRRETAVMSEIEELVDRFADDKDRAIREGGRSRIAAFFGPATVRRAEFPNHQEFDFEGLRGRLLSCSYIPNEDDPRSREMDRALRLIFEKYERNGTIRFEYRTEVYWGRLT